MAVEASAGRLARRAAGTLAKKGAAETFGDEFTVLLPDVGPGDAQMVASRLQASLSEPIEFAGVTFRVTVSIGVAICRPGPASDRAALFKLAGDALYAAKKGGRNQLRVFEMPDPVTAI